jgi:uncharacterized membrane protein
MTAYAILFTMAAIGVAETVYLIRTRWEADAQVICPIGGGCHAVLESKYNKLFGVHNDLLGFLFYASSAVLMSLVVIDVGPVEVFASIVAVMTLGAAVMSLRFVYLQWRVIKQWCFWCLMSAATVAVMLLTILIEFPETLNNLTSLLG